MRKCEAGTSWHLWDICHAAGTVRMLSCPFLLNPPSYSTKQAPIASLLQSTSCRGGNWASRSVVIVESHRVVNCRAKVKTYIIKIPNAFRQLCQHGSSPSTSSSTKLAWKDNQGDGGAQEKTDMQRHIWYHCLLMRPGWPKQITWLNPESRGRCFQLVLQST